MARGGSWGVAIERTAATTAHKLARHRRPVTLSAPQRVSRAAVRAGERLGLWRCQGFYVGHLTEGRLRSGVLASVVEVIAPSAGLRSSSEGRRCYSRGLRLASGVPLAIAQDLSRQRQHRRAAVKGAPPAAIARLRPSPVRSRISSRSNSAMAARWSPASRPAS
jgi:hypothetical protein